VIEEHRLNGVPFVGHFSQSSENFAENCVVLEQPNNLDELTVTGAVFLLDVLCQYQIVYLIVNFSDLVVEVLAVIILGETVSLSVINQQIGVTCVVPLHVAGTEFRFQIYHFLPNL
jgi:hypothetical protein